MIPKVILQTSKAKLPQYGIDMTMQKCVGWEYKHFTDEEVIEFLEANPLEEFPQAIEKFNGFINGAHKSDFFRYYFLYINGGFHIDSDALIQTDIENIIQNYSFVSVLSGVREKSLFQGILGCIPKHPIILKALTHAYNVDITELNEPKKYFLLCDEIYNIIHEEGTNYENIKLYKEEKDESVYFVNTYNVDTTPKQKLFTHYFKNKILPKQIKKPTTISETKIAVSFSFPNDAMGIFSNGIRQNVLFLYDLLANIGYDVYLLIDDNDKSKSEEINFWNKKDKYKYTTISKLIHEDFHIVIQIGREIEMYILEFLKVCGIKTIYYCCGNKYLTEGEQCLFRNKDNEDAYFQYNQSTYFQFTQVWLIPQHINSCTHYLKTLYRSTVVNVPFVWAPSVLEEYEKELGKSCLYKNRGPNKKIGIFEPNLSLMKWSLPSVLVCENAQRSLVNKSLIDSIYITNISTTSNDTFSNKIFNKLVTSLDLFKYKKLSVESRYNTLFFMSKYSDIAVSHQTENPLNYLYLDLAWMGWPVVHNANLCSDVGYYYDGFNYEEGGEMLKHVILTHDENADKYIKKNRAIIDRYLPTNKDIQEQYKTLVNNILEL
jgi:hypothetical protein